MEKQKYPCVLRLRLWDGRNYWTSIQHFKIEEDFNKWMHDQAFYGTKVIDYDDFTIDSEIDGPVHYKTN